MPTLNDSTWCIRLFIRQTTKAAPTDNNPHVDGSGTTVKVPFVALNEKSASVIPLGVFNRLIVEKFPEYELNAVKRLYVVSEEGIV
jgi:hypothetical protein